jgi:hypothetical protein
MEHVLDALDQINADYEGHSAAARAIAKKFFAAEQVLASLLEDAGL